MFQNISFLGPPVQLNGSNGAVGSVIDNRITCMVRREDGSVGHGPCSGLKPACPDGQVLRLRVDGSQVCDYPPELSPIPGRGAITGQPAVSGGVVIEGTNWLMIGAIALGVYLITKK